MEIYHDIWLVYDSYQWFVWLKKGGWECQGDFNGGIFYGNLMGTEMGIYPLVMSE